MNISQWCYTLNYLGSKKSYYQLSKIIKENCLASTHRLTDGYLVDDDKAWLFLIVADDECYKTAQKLRIYCAKDVEPWYERMQYRLVWRSNKIAYKKTKI